jgi:transketolase
LSLRKVFAETITEIARVDERLIVFVGDISHGIFKELRQDFPDRYYNIGICEPGMLNVAAGLSAKGLIPVVHTIAPFLIERSYEQIKLDFAYQGLGVNLISVGGAFDYAKLGCSHHCYTDYSLLSKFSKSNIFFPGSDIEFRSIFKNVYNNGEMNYFRLTEFPHDISFESSEIKVGKAIKISSGSDLTIVTAGAALKRVKEATYLLNKSGYSVDILYYHTLKPFDSKIVFDSVSKTKKVIVFEENSSEDGLFKLVNNSISGKFVYDIRQMAINDFVRTYGTYEYLCEITGLSTSNLLKVSLSLIEGH